MKRFVWKRALLVGLLAGGLVACEKTAEEGESTEAQAQSAAAAADEGEAEAAPAEPKMNAKVVEYVDKAVTNCEVREESVQAYSCEGDVLNEYQTWIREEKPEHVFETLGALAVGDDSVKSAAAVAVMGWGYASAGDEWKQANATPAARSTFLEYVAKSEGLAASKAAKFAAHIGGLRGEMDEVFEVVRAHKDNKAKAGAYEAYMTYGRLDGFEELKSVTEGLDDVKLLQAALGAPLKMYKATDEEKAAYCPWAEAYLGHENLGVVTDASRVMVRCGGEYVDKMLAEGEKRVEAGEFKRPYSQVFREPCANVLKLKKDDAEKVAQCDRVFAFLKEVADNEEVEPKVRAMSLWNIYYQRRDQKTLDLMREYANHEVPEIKEYADDAIESLTTTYKLK